LIILVNNNQKNIRKMADNTISLEKAKEWARLYRKDDPDGVIAFLIPKIDVTQLLNQNGVSNFRAYLGYDPEKKMEKLMIVGVDENGKDLIDEKLGNYIYDMTSPCPKTCDITSPLFNLDEQVKS
jgi:hypothetical protein